MTDDDQFPAKPLAISLGVQILVVQMLLQSTISIITLTGIAASAIGLLAGSK